MNDRTASGANAPRPFSGYRQTSAVAPDPELTQVGPGTPGGEYLRRFWHPVGLTADIKDVPLRRRILGEDLVLFRDRGGRFGLLHLNCAHRQASLEYGVCEPRGLRCCYHGWLFDIDGTVLEMPGEDAAVVERARGAFFQGAYPVREHNGLVFAYLGPIEERPPFPIYDAYDIPGMTMVPYAGRFECNWLQVLDAIVDPLHTSFLHSRVSRLQFSQGFGEMGELTFYERANRVFATNTRRVGDHVWVRVNEMILPNFTQAGAAGAADGTRQRYFGRSSFTRWVVPIDDTNSMALAWANFGERGDPPSWNTPEKIEILEQGERFDRPYAERQRFPGDLEATTGMGPITVHKREHLMPTDRGVVGMRRLLRQAIRDLKDGRRPMQPSELAPGSPSAAIPTYGGDTVLRLPARPGLDDQKYRHDIAARVMQLHFAADALQGAARDQFMIGGLKELEAAEASR